MFISPSDSSQSKIIMSKYIPGNQKYLTLNWKKTSFRDIVAFLYKDPTTISKEVYAIVSLTGITKRPSTMPKTFVFTAIIAKNKCLWKKSCFVV